MQSTVLYTASQCRDLDLFATDSGIEGYTLMCRAGQAALDLLCRLWPAPLPVHVVCGLGNNGGDGLVLARLLHLQGRNVTVYLCGDPKKYHGEAECAYVDAQIQGVKIQAFSAQQDLIPGVIVDALLGIGLQGPVRESMATIINWINNSLLPVLSLDIPSGLCADTGNVLGVAVKAEKTITFIADKRGLHTGKGVDYTGEVIVDELSLPRKLFSRMGEGVRHLDLETLLPLLPVRSRNAHKGLFGHVLVIGGNKGMAGAVLMAAEACVHAGAGLVSVATLPEHVSAIISRRPEIMAHGVGTLSDIKKLLDAATVVVIGPGLGTGAWAGQMLHQAMACGLPLVVDADALNLVSAGKVAMLPFPAQWIITPHPGEAARLCGTTVEAITVDRFSAVQCLQAKYGATVILKGAGSLIADGESIALCSYGNAGMASGGMGDVLSGLAGALLAQGLSPGDASRLAVAVHAKAADIAVSEQGIRGLLASDLIPITRQLLNGTT